jgi:hypothetical protein
MATWRRTENWTPSSTGGGGASVRPNCAAAARRTAPRNATCGLVLLVLPIAALAQEHAAVLELGGAAEWDSTASESHFGPSLAIEVTPIEKWLELELGVNAFRISGKTEWEADLLFKKPFDLSPTTELMVGLGPTWTHSSVAGDRPNSAGAEFALDFMFWPTRRWGWYVEPSYSVALQTGHPKSPGVTAGLLIAIP